MVPKLEMMVALTRMVVRGAGESGQREAGRAIAPGLDALPPERTGRNQTRSP